MKKTFFAGLAILLPIAITVIIVVFFVDFLTAPFTDVVENAITYYGGEIAEHHRHFLVLFSRLIVLALIFLLILILGFLGQRFFFSYFLHLTDGILNKIPYVKSIYRISLDVTKNVFSVDKEKLFQGTALVPFPHQNSYALGLLSGNPPSEVQTKQKKELKSVFIPTAPHPISGFLLMYAKDEIKHIDIETEDLFKFLLSCGIYQPKEKNQNEK